MINKYPLWKYLLILTVLAFGVIYAMPNLYPDDPAVQLTSQRSSVQVGEAEFSKVAKALDAAGIEHFGEEITSNTAVIRFRSDEDQLKAKTIIQETLGENYVVALNLAPTTPQWLVDLGAGPMKLGLDLRGGVHFLMEVDMKAAISQRNEVYASEIKTLLRTERIRYRRLTTKDGSISIRFNDAELRDQAKPLLRKEFADFMQTERDNAEGFFLELALSETAVRNIEDYAVKQNLTTLRNRVNELGVSEPLVQRQGRNRIVIELPGVQDTAAAKRVLGATANLEFRLEASSDTNTLDSEEHVFRNNPDRTAVLEKDIIITGNSVSNALSAFDENGQPQVNIDLDTQGGKLINRATRNNIRRRMAVLFVEHKMKTRIVEVAGEKVEQRTPYVEKHIISLATIQSALGNSFRITGLDSPAESSELALLLRAGSLAAPIYFVEERTIGPSLGKENIELGITSVQIGMALVVVFMLVYYRMFGLFANLALTANLVLLAALMSMMSATLTLPGIAGIVLTLGMAVDANVLIFSRIKEEIQNGMSPPMAIHSGFERAFITIFDANLTTLLVAVILFAVGTGPVKGFAVTLSLGILTSMFTAIMVTRALVNIAYGGRQLKKLSI
ncbi:preprotein translocase subunit SecD [Oceanospirillum multiglobuliferum]|uniref:Protein translocase subunit SecD n=1 Tax=Oceanospirillum multiglobuliferum TaxID=64969 RepID=A0A1T4M1Y7_9GAMM|nr:protein translocase subunit SecD [Oceanospirillum multiglobuliferum]OPX56276.1 protein-export membrane protein SecD [Oceanospirillum multiglobuliferum]SJZ60906.1 preprotein translocase subunit SecD [Oceanospirillum multiglobuliferum]